MEAQASEIVQSKSRRQRKRDRQQQNTTFYDIWPFRIYRWLSETLGRWYNDLEPRRKRAITFAWYLVLAVLWVAAFRRFGSPWVAVSTILAIFYSVSGPSSKQQRGYSAYSVFNPGQRSLLGDLRAEDIERELRHGLREEGDSNLIELPPDLMRCPQDLSRPLDRKSDLVNKPCLCGSGLKTKRCCGSRIVTKQRQFNEKTG